MTDAGSGRHAVALTPMRRAIARRMSDSKRDAPHFYESVDVEMDALLAALSRRNEGRALDGRVTVTAALVRALAVALVQHPAFNATWDGETLARVDTVNVGVAVEVPDGLVAPALLGCERLDLEETSGALRDLVARARAGRLRAPEWSEATFTLSNLGMFRIDAFTAIVVPPQVAILATGRTAERPVVRDGNVTPRQMMTLTLSADHRAVDGAGAARFLGTLTGLLEEPDPWMRAATPTRGVTPP